MGTVNIYQNFKGYKIRENVRKVSVIIPNYNYSRFLVERIDSIINQTYPIHELIILDDASTDDSRRVIREKAKLITDIPVKILFNETNSGLVFSQWQKGLKEAEGDYIWIAEADDSCEPVFLETLMKSFDDENVVLSYCDSKRINDENNIIRSNCQDLYNMFHCDHWDHSFVTKGEDEIKQYLSVLNTILNVSGVVWKKLDGLYDIFEEAKNFKVAGDWYIYTKVLEQGDLAFHSECLNYYRKHTNSVTSSVHCDIEYREIVKIEEMIASKYHLDMETYRWQRLRRSYMDANVSPEVKKKKIAWVIPYPGRGSGGHRTIIQNVNALIRHGYECDIISEDDGASTNETVARKIDEFYETCAANVYLGLSHIETYDMVFATGWQTLDMVRKIPCRKNAYFIQDFEPWFFPMGNEYLIIEDSYRRGYSPVTIGRWLANKMETEFGAEAHYFDFCADLNIYHPIEAVEKEDALCYVWQPEKPRRGSELAFRALKIVKEKRPQTKIYLYGSIFGGPVPFEAERLGIISTEECNKLYNRCRVGLCMSASNPSRIPFEMMAAGLPVVELYRENNLYDLPMDGVLLAESSPESVAAAILELLENTERNDKMSAFGPQFMKNYPLEKGFEQFVQAVDSLVYGTECSQPKAQRVYLHDAYKATPEFRKEAIELLYKEEPPVVPEEIRTPSKPVRGYRILKRKARTALRILKQRLKR
ncbi:MAG: glycosyltransferase [Solobacterium sp.]|nr:glycosyltransferase [Solobacterium sp.]